MISRKTDHVKIAQQNIYPKLCVLLGFTSYKTLTEHYLESEWLVGKLVGRAVVILQVVRRRRLRPACSVPRACGVAAFVPRQCGGPVGRARAA